MTSGFRLVLIDCPPNLGELTRNALYAADQALVITEPSFFAVQSAAQSIESIEVARAAGHTDLKLLGILATRVRPRFAEHRYRLRELNEAFGDVVLPPIPDRTAIQQAQGSCVPVQRWRSQSAKAASAAFDELLDLALAQARRPRPRRGRQHGHQSRAAPGAAQSPDARVHPAAPVVGPDSPPGVVQAPPKPMAGAKAPTHLRPVVGIGGSTSDVLRRVPDDASKAAAKKARSSPRRPPRPSASDAKRGSSCKSRCPRTCATSCARTPGARHQRRRRRDLGARGLAARLSQRD